MWSHVGKLVTLVTQCHNFHMCQKLQKSSKKMKMTKICSHRPYGCAEGKKSYGVDFLDIHDSWPHRVNGTWIAIPMTDPMRTSSQWCLKSIALLTAAAKARQKKLIWIAATMKVLEMRGWTYIAEMRTKLRGFMPTTHADGEDRRNLSLEVQDAPGGCREGVARVTRHEALALILQFSLHVLFVEYLLTHKKLVQPC